MVYYQFVMNPVTQVRSFNRSYTKILGLLNDRILESPLSLTESRIIYELAEQGVTSAKVLSTNLAIDKGYLSRTLKRLEKQGYLLTQTSEQDKRSKTLVLSKKGKLLFETVNQASEQQIRDLLSQLSIYERERFIRALGQAQQLIEKEKMSLAEIEIRNHLLPGDVGFLLQAHSELYHLEHDFGVIFDKYVAEGVVEFLNQSSPNRNRVWMCEHNHNRIGFIMLMDRGEVAQLRYFFLYPEYRGIGLGGHLMNCFMEELKTQQFKGAYLWTANGLPAAAHLYRKHGFELVEEVPSTAFGKELLELKYELKI